MKNPDSSLTLKLDRARDFLLTRLPFYGALSMHLPDILTDSPDCQTAQTNGREIRWSRAFLGSLSEEETRFVIAHETLHCAHGHLWRLKADQLGNLAADYEVNETLADLHGLKMPECAAAQPGVFPGLACEEILAALAANPPPPPQDGTGAAGPGDFTTPAEESPASPESPAKITLEEKWQAAVESAGQAAAALAGTLPGDLARILAERRRVKLDWRNELAAFLRAAIGHRADYSRSARRMATAPIIYPRRMADTLGTVAVVRDTSGSISGPVLAAFNGCLASLREEMGCAVLLIDADSSVAALHEIAPGEDFPETAHGGGGTDFRPAFAEIRRRQEAGETFAGLIYLTDLDGPQPTTDQVTLETLWLCTTEKTATTGRTVRLESSH